MASHQVVCIVEKDLSSFGTIHNFDSFNIATHESTSGIPLKFDSIFRGPEDLEVCALKPLWDDFLTSSRGLNICLTQGRRSTQDITKQCMKFLNSQLLETRGSFRFGISIVKPDGDVQNITKPNVQTPFALEEFTESGSVLPAFRNSIEQIDDRTDISIVYTFATKEESGGLKFLRLFELPCMQNLDDSGDKAIQNLLKNFQIKVSSYRRGISVLLSKHPLTDLIDSDRVENFLVIHSLQKTETKEEFLSNLLYCHGFINLNQLPEEPMGGGRARASPPRMVEMLIDFERQNKQRKQEEQKREGRIEKLEDKNNQLQKKCEHQKQYIARLEAAQENLQVQRSAIFEHSAELGIQKKQNEEMQTLLQAKDTAIQMLRDKVVEFDKLIKQLLEKCKTQEHEIQTMNIERESLRREVKSKDDRLERFREFRETAQQSDRQWRDKHEHIKTTQLALDDAEKKIGELDAKNHDWEQKHSHMKEKLRVAVGVAEDATQEAADIQKQLDILHEDIKRERAQFTKENIALTQEAREAYKRSHESEFHMRKKLTELKDAEMDLKDVIHKKSFEAKKLKYETDIKHMKARHERELSKKNLIVKRAVELGTNELKGKVRVLTEGLTGTSALLEKITKELEDSRAENTRFRERQSQHEAGIRDVQSEGRIKLHKANLINKDLEEEIESWKLQMKNQESGVDKIIAELEEIEKKAIQSEIQRTDIRLELDRTKKECQLDNDRVKHHWTLKCDRLAAEVEDLKETLAEKKTELEQWRTKFREVDILKQRNMFDARSEKYKMQQEIHEFRVRTEKAEHGLQTEICCRKAEKEFMQKEHKKLMDEKIEGMQYANDLLRKTITRDEELMRTLEERKRKTIKELGVLLSEKGAKLEVELLKYNEYCRQSIAERNKIFDEQTKVEVENVRLTLELARAKRDRERAIKDLLYVESNLLTLDDEQLQERQGLMKHVDELKARISELEEHRDEAVKKAENAQVETKRAKTDFKNGNKEKRKAERELKESIQQHKKLKASAQTQLEEKEEEIKALTEKLAGFEEAKTQAKIFQSKYQDSRARVSRRDEEIRALKQKRTQLENEIEILNQSMAEKKSQLEKLLESDEKKAEGYRKKIEELEGRVGRRNAEIKQLTSNAKKLEKQLTQHQSDLDAKEAAIATFETEQGSELAELREQLKNDGKTNDKKLQEKIGRRDENIKRLTEMKKDLEKELRNVKTSIEEKDARIDEIEKGKEEELSELREQLKNDGKSNQTWLEKKISKRELEIKQLKAAKKVLEKEKKELRSSAEQKQEEIKELDESLSGLKEKIVELKGKNATVLAESKERMKNQKKIVELKGKNATVLAESKERMKNQKKKMKEFKEKLSSKHSQATKDAEKKLDEKVKELDDMKEKLEEMKEQKAADISNLQEQISSLETELLGMQDKADNHRGSSADRSRISNQQKRIAALTEEVKGLKAKLKKKAKEITSSAKKHDREKKEFQKLERAAKAHKTEMEKLTTEITKLKSSVSSKKKEIAEYKKKLRGGKKNQKQDKALEDLRKDLGEKTSELESVQKELKEAVADLDLQKNQVAQLETQLEGMSVPGTLISQDSGESEKRKWPYEKVIELATCFKASIKNIAQDLKDANVLKSPFPKDIKKIGRGDILKCLKVASQEEEERYLSDDEEMEQAKPEEKKVKKKVVPKTKSSVTREQEAMQEALAANGKASKLKKPAKGKAKVKGKAKGKGKAKSKAKKKAAPKRKPKKKVASPLKITSRRRKRELSEEGSEDEGQPVRKKRRKNRFESSASEEPLKDENPKPSQAEEGGKKKTKRKRKLRSKKSTASPSAKLMKDDTTLEEEKHHPYSKKNKKGR